MIDNIETDRPTDGQDTEPNDLPAVTGHHIEASLRCPCGAMLAIPIPGTSDGKFVVPDSLLSSADGFFAAHSHLGD